MLNFSEFINEAKKYEDDDFSREAWRSRKTMSRFGLKEYPPRTELVDFAFDKIESGNIYGLDIPPYPFVLAVSGAGDDFGNNGAWLIKSKEDFMRWIVKVSTGNKVFPDLSGEGYMEEEDFDYFEEDQIEEIKKQLTDYSDSDEYSNGYRVDFFKNEEEMDKHARETVKCQDCDGTGEYDDEECDSCDGSGESTHYEEEHDNHAVIDGDYFPEREVDKDW